MKLIKTFILAIGVALFRPIWSSFWKLVFWIFYAIRYNTNKEIREMYCTNLMRFKNIVDLQGLVTWFLTFYRYETDGPFGIFDHDNSQLEFFITCGDCDDMASFSMRKLRAMGYKADLVFLWGKKPFSFHTDCIFQGKDGKWNLFNYGYVITADTKKDALWQLGECWGTYENAAYLLYSPDNERFQEVL